MIEYEKKGFFNIHTLLNKDSANISNSDNNHVYSQLISGNCSSPMFSYLLNMNKQNLNDYKSIMFYNESNLASLINEAREMEELIDGSTVFLSKANKKIKMHFSKTLEQRHSTRSFVFENMDFSIFSNIMHFSFGISSRKLNFNDVQSTTRYYSSGGGLYPIDIYIYVNNVSGISKGIYKYQPYSNSLYPLNIDKVDAKSFFIGDNIDTQNMNFCVFFEYSINRNYVKYGELSLLNTFVELGGMSHNFDLVCHSMHYSTCPIAGFNKSSVEKFLFLDGVNDHIVFTNICGKE
ncbi:SagB/ThcOx family dehydrogenase [Listeria seeligeri]|uniref:SagB/ThcOx family dehydrogenase n=1 Tax=Listeria seeligeri TaxID=1640 RepID=UPI0016235BB7|nr:SagB family peptide dehydrogenase [Listeria seeligeri]MBC1480945.1 SagB/ThcOx family dehydrogenase [Listeria seeligeri]MBC1719491.1 SagB/ThcOx family dehydrogenase [Listeria seeligeri]MBC1734023.1 SagB/ThcOx family dehydrogenase [Listeria seeligeri]MBC1735896.1 SagB/ThcOx family dehydrogenase [Listeria seeligeri]MBC1856902.1 SagB/ThcOx family dehydrogenase [Listeria seeligeri]